MIEQELQAIEKRANAATPGPWAIRSIMNEIVTETRLPMSDFVVSYGLSNDAAFIAAARADVPALLAEVRRLQAELAALTTEQRIPF